MKKSPGRKQARKMKKKQHHNYFTKKYHSARARWAAGKLLVEYLPFVFRWVKGKLTRNTNPLKIKSAGKKAPAKTKKP